MNRAELDRVVAQTVARARVAASKRRRVNDPDLPDTCLEFASKYVYWPHAKTQTPVCSLNRMQLDFLERTSTFKWDADSGECFGGSAIIAKARQVRITTLGLDLMVHMALWFGARGIAKRFVLPLHSGLPKFLRPIKSNMGFMLDRLPESWANGWRRVGNTFIFPGGGTLELVTAGGTDKIADQVGRSGTISGGLWASEIAMYASPEATISAARSAMQADSTSLVAESTAGDDPEGYHAEEWRLSSRGEGSYDEAYFWPWYFDPLKRLGKTSKQYQRVMSLRFRNGIGAADLDLETQLRDEHSVDDEQIAWRRLERFTGTSEKRRLARRENPESFEEPYENPGKSFISPEALKLCRARTRKPLMERSWGEKSEVWCKIWVRKPPETVVFGGDCAAYGGQDDSYLSARGCKSREQYASIGGVGLPSDFATALEWLLITWFGTVEGHRNYVIAWETNRGKGHIEACRRRRLNLWHTMVDNPRDRMKPPHKRRQHKRWGFRTDGASRPEILSAISEAYEGPLVDADDNPRDPAPTVATYDAELVVEVGSLRPHKRTLKIVGHPHDDKAIADGIALHIAPTVKDRLGASRGGVFVPSGGRSRMGRSSPFRR